MPITLRTPLVQWIAGVVVVVGVVAAGARYWLRSTDPAPPLRSANVIGEPPPEPQKESRDLVETAASWSFRAASIKLAPRQIVINGPAGQKFGYLMVSNQRQFDEGMYIVADGTVMRGGLTVGIQQDNQWVRQFTAYDAGPFRISIQVPMAGSYRVVLANAVDSDGAENNVEVSSLVVVR